MSEEDNLPKLSECVSVLAAMRDEHAAFFEKASTIGGGMVQADDHLVIAALRRSLDNTNGLLAMADQKNIFCGVPILRFQIDTAMVLFARTLVADVTKFAKHIFEGKKLRNYRDRHGNKLQDWYLHQELDKKHPHVSDLYGLTSGFVHFSKDHMLWPLDIKESKLQKKLVFKDIEELTVGWDERSIRETLVSFMWATEAILRECVDWWSVRCPKSDADDPHVPLPISEGFAKRFGRMPGTPPTS